MSDQNPTIAQVSMQLEILKPVDTVWRALTDQIGDWWPQAFYVGGSEGGREIKLETQPGGRMYESWAGGGGLLWGTVVTVEPGKLLQITGTTFPNWGGPSHWYGSWELSASDNGTLLKFSDSTLGRISDGRMAENDKGWTFLWQTLKAHVEGQPAPVWTD